MDLNLGLIKKRKKKLYEKKINEQNFSKQKNSASNKLFTPNFGKNWEKVLHSEKKEPD